MLSLVFVSTFLCIGLGAAAVWQRLDGRRRAQALLAGRDPVRQRATVIRTPGLAERWEAAARQAGLDWTARQYLTAIGGGALLGLLLTLTGSTGLGLLVVAGSVLGPWLVVRHRQRVRTEQMAAQLPAALTLAANTIRAGGTLLQAVRAVARQLPDPIGTEFARVEQALMLQVPLAAALDQARQRIGVPEFTSVVVACKVAGQTGGDLDVILENIAREIVEDRQFREQMRALSAEGRTSAKVVTVMPFALAGLMLLRNPGYFQPMLTSPGGTVLLAICLASIAVGWFIISRITDVRNW